MDIRLLSFWKQKAIKNGLIDQMRIAQAVRLGMNTDGAAFNRCIGDIERLIKSIDEDGSKDIAEGWQDLKDIGRG